MRNLYFTFFLSIAVSVTSFAQTSRTEFVTKQETIQRIGDADIQRLPRGIRFFTSRWSKDLKWVWASVSVNGAEPMVGWIWTVHLQRLRVIASRPPSQHPTDYFEPVGSASTYSPSQVRPSGDQIFVPNTYNPNNSMILIGPPEGGNLMNVPVPQ